MLSLLQGYKPLDSFMEKKEKIVPRLLATRYKVSKFKPLPLNLNMGLAPPAPPALFFDRFKLFCWDTAVRS